MREIGVVGALWLLLQAPACASDLALEDGRFRDPELGYSLADPRALAPGWRRAELEGATLAFRGPEGAAASLMVDCHRTRADARTLSRHLLFGLEAREVVEEGPVSADGARAFRRVVRVRADGEPLRLETVTRVAGGCAYDWVLVTPGEPGAAGELFARWWRSFRGGSAEEGAAPPQAAGEPRG